MINILLASRSPRRRELIRLLGYPFRSIAADVDESSVALIDPAENVKQTAHLKASVIAEQLEDTGYKERTVIVAADTTVAFEGEMLGKPADEAEALRMLRALRGGDHHVHTGITLIDMATGRIVSDVHTARVTMRPYAEQEIAAYIATGDPMDKAGAYAIQHPMFRPVAHLEGCYTGVMGLSVCHLIQTLLHLDVPVKADMTALLEAHQQYCCPLYDELSVHTRKP